MMTVKQETRQKGPWTEQEDGRLLCSVQVFGDRRWDFIARVSGLKRTGKSCRLRWVNYLHPGLKRGRMTPQEELLILDLHSRWGNRWSRIARRLPGRTDNEIKNYWRTHTRRRAQERRASSPGPSSSSSCVLDESMPVESSTAENAPQTGGTGVGGGSTCDSAGAFPLEDVDKVVDWYQMDQIWNELPAPAPAPEMGPGILGCYEEADDGGACSVVPSTAMASPLWGDCSGSDLIWKLDDEDFKTMFLPQ